MTTRIDHFSAPAPDGPSPVNAWIVGDDEEVIVIDPGPDAAGLLDAVGDREVLAVICTHGHADHVAAALEVAERARLLALAHDLGLVTTGGSDDHGSLTGYRLGCETTPAEAYQDLLSCVPGNPSLGVLMAVTYQWRGTFTNAEGPA